jgi:hypothetical protein
MPQPLRGGCGRHVATGVRGLPSPNRPARRAGRTTSSTNTCSPCTVVGSPDHSACSATIASSAPSWPTSTTNGPSPATPSPTPSTRDSTLRWQPRLERSTKAEVCPVQLGHEVISRDLRHGRLSHPGKLNGSLTELHRVGSGHLDSSQRRPTSPQVRGPSTRGTCGPSSSHETRGGPTPTVDPHTTRHPRFIAEGPTGIREPRR